MVRRKIKTQAEACATAARKKPEAFRGFRLSMADLLSVAYWQIATELTVYICARMKSRMVNSVCTSVNFPLGHALASC